MSRPQAQKPRGGYKGRILPTSGFGTHGDGMKDADKKGARASWRQDNDIQDEVNNWKDYLTS